MRCCGHAGAAGQARGPTRHPAALSARLPRMLTGSARIGIGDAAGRGADDAVGPVAAAASGSRKNGARARAVRACRTICV